ncbi:MAG: hypothetical protein RLZZ600_560 [Actinomycetota bacterium]|jgi:DUF2075 family protein/predicted GIY-YIG superfamily endonuclease
MTSSKIERFPFDRRILGGLSDTNSRLENWPVVYTIENDKSIYVGETTNARVRMQQHLDSPAKQGLKRVRVIVNEEFNKSVCLDLESHLIRYLAADEKYEVINGNHGISDADYFERARYREDFDEVFTQLFEQGVLTRSIPDIVNSNLFKYSPYKALNTDQAAAVEEILERLFETWSTPTTSPMVVQGDPGTGKTIVAIYLMKLLADIASSDLENALESDSLFADFFQPGYKEIIGNPRIGLVIPQQSLRKTVQKVFAKTPGLDKNWVISPFDLNTRDAYDLLIVDEAHRLGQRANQPSAAQNKKFTSNNLTLFGDDDSSWTQLDWVKASSRHQLLLVDAAQSVKPGDLPLELVESLIREARSENALFRLHSQMRVTGGSDYIDFVCRLMNLEHIDSVDFGDYDFRIFDDFSEMREAILARDEEVGLSRLVAGYAWPWASRTDKTATDIEIDGVQMQWNQTPVDWINSPNSVNEVGSIHTVQGYDLNYAGVIIGPDLGYDEATGQPVFNRDNYFDTKGKENNPRLGISYSDEDLLEFVRNIYRVLLTRGIKGTYVYFADKALESAVRALFLN